MNIIDNVEITFSEIKNIINNKKQFLIGRMPGIEAENLRPWFQNGNNVNFIDSSLRHLLEQNTGFYSDEENYNDVLDCWCKLTLDGLINCDLLFRLETSYASKNDFMISDFYNAIHVWSAVNLHQWIPLLKNKKILVISSFEDSIKMQWKHRKKLFLSGHTPFEFPDFELKTIKSHNTIKDNEPYPHKNWKESFESMCSEIDNIDFDIAILGCGGYGMPLANYIKNIGKGSFYVGSYVQIMFGIKGKRWYNQQGTDICSYWNDFWKSPEKHEIPKTFKNVEQGAYWL